MQQKQRQRTAWIEFGAPFGAALFAAVALLLGVCVLWAGGGDAPEHVAERLTVLFVLAYVMDRRFLRVPLPRRLGGRGVAAYPRVYPLLDPLVLFTGGLLTWSVASVWL